MKGARDTRPTQATEIGVTMYSFNKRVSERLRSYLTLPTDRSVRIGLHKAQASILGRGGARGNT